MTGLQTVIDELDAWENRWFPIAEATLRRRKPGVADRLFLNLTQTSGLEVAVSVSTFVQRLRELEKDGTIGAEALGRAGAVAWYMEWGTIARNSIQNGNLLRGLGFLTSNGGKIVEEPDGGDLPLPATTTQLATQPNPNR